MKSQAINVGFCVAYDWPLLARAIPLVYADADRIVLSLDKSRISWSLKPFEFDDAGFNQLIRQLDKDQKIILVEEDFHLPELSPMQNEVRQRTELARHMGTDGWFIQLDCDEYFPEFPAFAAFLRSRMPQRPVNVCCKIFTLFKSTPAGYLVIDPIHANQLEYIQLATNRPEYHTGRRNGWFNLYTNFSILHQSWARSEAEIAAKIRNWGHSQDFDPEVFRKFWQELSETNYHQFRNIHPIVPQVWPALKLIGDVTSVPEDFPRLSSWQLRLKNSIWLSRLRSVFKKILP